ncbi:flagellar hook protein FlgE [Noviherbaspirillum pedocola]|uniref:Flagellar hook protein FlgE n=1 Tax=Noviherbaspirillum pedocola TaxID=2801341 RepID=A0A934T1J0_9BURK|nr:flagellar hook protein FlgE [Noviherbaspirillum pedocola]MBK4737024.1 flagellar hook protein FlgE [Noviherbaspirillum pedocola]
MSFQQGLSGLNAASKSLEVIGNNVSNANTVGFKAAQAQFADVYATSLNGGGASDIGIGTKISDVVQEFNQGNITASDNPLDIAINGNGFFRMDSNGTVTYARNGQFQLDKNGYVVNAQGANLTGYVANAAGVLSTGSPQKLQISTADLPPAVTKSVNQALNLDSTQAIPATTPFSATDPTSYNNATSVSVYDSLGNSHVLQTFYVNAGSGNWDVYAVADDVPLVTTPAGGKIGTLSFDTTGALTAASKATLPFSAPIPASGGAAAFSPQIDFTGTTQYGSAFTVNSLSQNGYAAGHLTGFTTGDDGTITGRYSNGKSATLGQVVLANFTNVNGLQPLGNNVWAETSSSGQPLVATPGSGTFGKLQASAVEDSNVDLTAELVNMITAQRVYQANAQTVKTQDQVMQTLVNLR